MNKKEKKKSILKVWQLDFYEYVYNDSGEECEMVHPILSSSRVKAYSKKQAINRGRYILRNAGYFTKFNYNSSVMYKYDCEAILIEELTEQATEEYKQKTKRKKKVKTFEQLTLF